MDVIGNQSEIDLMKWLFMSMERKREREREKMEIYFLKIGTKLTARWRGRVAVRRRQTGGIVGAARGAAAPRPLGEGGRARGVRGGPHPPVRWVVSRINQVIIAVGRRTRWRMFRC